MAKYEKIIAEIRKKIISGEYKTNEKIPYERDLCKYFGASKMTVKKALDSLVREGLIIKRRGSGTYVKNLKTEELAKVLNKNQFTGLTNYKKGHEVTSKILEFKIINCSKKICDILNIDTSDLVYYIHRVRYIDSEPTVIEKVYMPLNTVRGLKIKDAEESIYSCLKNKLNLKIQSSHVTIKAKKSNELDWRYLLLNKDEPVVEMENIGYLDTGKVFEYSFSRHRYDKYEFETIVIHE